jgi:hypothetical protein
MTLPRLDRSYFDQEVRPLLGSLLIEKGMITSEQLDEALRERADTGDRLGEILLRRRWLFEDELARALAEQLGLKSLSFTNISVDAAAVALLPPEIGAATAAVPVRFERDGTVLVVAADPSVGGLVETLESAMRWPVTLAIGLQSEIAGFWRRFGY